MLNYTSLKKEIKAFVDLPAGKQIIYFMLTVILLFGTIIYHYNKKLDNVNIKVLKELNDCQISNKELEMKLDSALIDKYNFKVEYLNKQILERDSLLRESKNIEKSIKPLVKKLNKKIDEVNN